MTITSFLKSHNLPNQIMKKPRSSGRIGVAGLLLIISCQNFGYSLPEKNKSSFADFNIPNKLDSKSSTCDKKDRKYCRYWLPLFKPFCYRLYQIWEEGNNELVLSGYAWHNRFTYGSTLLRTKHYNELAWGGGMNKGFFDEKGNWHGLYAFAFLDSHKNVEPAAGYAYLKVLNITEKFKAGLGFSALVTARPDIMHNIPFPGVVPWGRIFYKKISLNATYIPGSSTNGNVLYIVGAYTFDK